MKRKGRVSASRKSKNSSKSADMRLRIERAIRMIPRGKVSTYGAVARGAGFPGAARQVAAILRRGFGLQELEACGMIPLESLPDRNAAGTGAVSVESRWAGRLPCSSVRLRH